MQEQPDKVENETPDAVASEEQKNIITMPAAKYVSTACFAACLISLFLSILFGGISSGVSTVLSLLAVTAGAATIISAFLAAAQITVAVSVGFAFLVSLAAHGIHMLSSLPGNAHTNTVKFIVLGIAAAGTLAATWIWTDHIWRFFSSRQFAIAILIILTVCVFLGTALRPIDGSLLGFCVKNGKWLFRNGVALGIIDPKEAGSKFQVPLPDGNGTTTLNESEALFGRQAYIVADGMKFADAFHSWWFTAYAVLLAVSCIFCALDRWPFRLRDAGFVTAHLALILIMFGASLYGKYGSEGKLELSDNAEMAAPNPETYFLTSYQVPPVESGKYVEIPPDMNFRTPVKDRIRNLGFTLKAKKIWLEKHEPRFRLAASALVDCFHCGGREKKSCRACNSEGKTAQGRFPIKIRPGKTSEIFDTGWTIEFGSGIINPGSGIAGGNASLVFYEPKTGPGGNDGEIKKPEDPHQIEMGQTAALAELEKKYDRAESVPISHGSVMDRSGHRLEVAGLWRDGSVDMHPSEDGPMADSWRRPLLRVDWVSPDGGTGRAYCFGRKSAGMPVMLELGKLPFHFRFEFQAPPQPGMEITVKNESGAAHWKGVVTDGDDRIDVCGGKLRLAFSVESPVRDYFTRVEVIDENGAMVVPEFDIEVNRPLKYGGFSFYQSGMSPGKGYTATTLSVKRDPGWPLVFLGFCALWTGIGLMFFVHRLRRKEAKNGN
ncbi:MAG: cytochrome c biogenesis protein ResB [Planctomycetota bacterium]|jgi:hypothetical protein